MTQPLHIDGPESSDAFAPGVDHHVADAVHLGGLRYRGLIRLAQDLQNLFSRKNGSSSWFLAPRGTILRGSS